MFEILIIMFAGMALGLIVKNQKTILAFTERLTMVAIYLLLFLLGQSVAGNDKVISNFAYICWQSFLLTLCCIAGSVICSYLLYIFLFKEKED